MGRITNCISLCFYSIVGESYIHIYSTKLKFNLLNSELQATIDWSNESTRALEDRIRFVAEAKMNERWKHHKCTLRADWYKPNINTNARFVCGDPHVDPRQWSLLVAYWDSEKGQVSLKL